MIMTLSTPSSTDTMIIPTIHRHSQRYHSISGKHMSTRSPFINSLGTKYSYIGSVQLPLILRDSRAESSPSM